MVTRRQFLACMAVVLADRQAACADPSDDGRLNARPRRPLAAIDTGRHPLGLGGDRDGVFYVPRGYKAGTPAPLFVMLHGAGGRGRITETVQALADEFGVAVLAPDSRAGTWGIVQGDARLDVRFIDSALAHLFEHIAVDARRLVIAGFSDGATCALWLGTANGDLFSHVTAFSPGFLVAGSRRGSPRIFISHGTRDEVLPIDLTSRRLVPQLQEAGYRVTYREFDGPHTVTAPTVREVFEWFTK